MRLAWGAEEFTERAYHENNMWSLLFTNTRLWKMSQDLINVRKSKARSAEVRPLVVAAITGTKRSFTPKTKTHGTKERQN